MTHELMIRSAEELGALPNFAVVEDHNNQVWQKLPLTLAQLRANYYRPFREGSYGWFKPGDDKVYTAAYVGRPARLLDDGL